MTLRLRRSADLVQLLLLLLPPPGTRLRRSSYCFPEGNVFLAFINPVPGGFGGWTGRVIRWKFTELSNIFTEFFNFLPPLRTPSLRPTIFEVHLNQQEVRPSNSSLIRCTLLFPSKFYASPLPPSPSLRSLSLSLSPTHTLKHNNFLSPLASRLSPHLSNSRRIPPRDRETFPVGGTLHRGFVRYRSAIANVNN